MDYSGHGLFRGRDSEHPIFFSFSAMSRSDDPFARQDPFECQLPQHGHSAERTQGLRALRHRFCCRLAIFLPLPHCHAIACTRVDMCEPNLVCVCRQKARLVCSHRARSVRAPPAADQVVPRAHSAIVQAAAARAARACRAARRGLSADAYGAQGGAWTAVRRCTSLPQVAMPLAAEVTRRRGGESEVVGRPAVGREGRRGRDASGWLCVTAVAGTENCIALSAFSQSDAKTAAARRTCGRCERMSR